MTPATTLQPPVRLTKQQVIEHIVSETFALAAAQAEGQPDGTEISVMAPLSQYRGSLLADRYDAIRHALRRGAEEYGLEMLGMVGPECSFVVLPATG